MDISTNITSLTGYYESRTSETGHATTNKGACPLADGTADGRLKMSRSPKMSVEKHTQRATVPSGTECEKPYFSLLFFWGTIADNLKSIIAGSHLRVASSWAPGFISLFNINH
ncbi:MAG: hypothetical protein LBN71_10810 [Tannerella sp.]|jgi:hypothetical protein|nr:hypothetical protein [Tannerella sp.]